MANEQTTHEEAPSLQKRKRGRPRNSPDREHAVRAERKEKYWGAAFNERRRQKYAEDPERADKIRQQRREAYARKQGNDAEPAKSCLANVAQVDISGALLAVRCGDSPMVIGRVFTQTDLAKLLDRQPQVMYRWHQRGIFPSPVLVDDKGNTYYGDEEVKDFIRIMGEHQLTTPHYRVDHLDVKTRLFGASFQGNTGRALNWINTRTK